MEAEQKARLFCDTYLCSNKVVLVPYGAHHVAKYHDWMLNKALLDATASDPLTLEEEYAMQTSWAKDLDKAAWIVLANSGDAWKSCAHAELEYMAGDVNAFISQNEDGCVAELEVMIAEPKYRKMGLATEAICIMMHWLQTHLPGLDRFIAKIHRSNHASLQLFQKLGFEAYQTVEIFNETHLRRSAAPENIPLYHAAPYPVHQ
jgi:RimJ/RimL family protein N-acetyltransferase